MYIYDDINAKLFEITFLNELALSFPQQQQQQGSNNNNNNNNIRSLLSIQEYNYTGHYVIVGIRTGVDYILENTYLYDNKIKQSESPSSSFNILQQSSSSSSSSTGTANNNTPSTTTLNLYQQWLQLQQQYNNTVINNQASSQYNGGFGQPSGIYDPSCSIQYQQQQTSSTTTNNNNNNQQMFIIIKCLSQ
eukprot:UN01107